MNKKDRERVEKIKLHCELGPLYHDDNCTCDTCFFLSLIDKQDKVVEAAKHEDIDVLCQALKDLDGESPQPPPRK